MIGDVSLGIQRKFIIITSICGFFIFVETIGAYLSNSIAIFTDVAHLFSDLIGFVLSLVAICLAKRKANLQYSYGFVRAEILGALLSIIIIWILTIWIVFEAIDRIEHKSYNTLVPYIMLINAIIGLGVNLLMGFTLHGGIDHESPGH